MAITIKAAGESVLAAGDKITVGITSAVRIHGDDNWFKLEVSTAVRSGESADDAQNRVVGFTHEQFTKFVNNTAQLIIELDDSAAK